MAQNDWRRVDADSFATQVRNALPTLYRVSCAEFALPADREEAVAECIAKAWEKSGHLREERYFRTWLVRILINVCHDIQRRNSREVLAFCDLEIETALEPEPGPEPGLELEPESLWDEDRIADLREALAKLDAASREALVLFYLEDYSTAEIADLLDEKPGAIRTRLSRARTRLLHLLDTEKG
jgi:RNA polymerase sigma-70 factor (ECF subfamily)